MRAVNTYDEREALLAELAEALRLFVDVNPSTLHINEVCRRHDVARAAIAKAGGFAPVGLPTVNA